MKGYKPGISLSVIDRWIWSHPLRVIDRQGQE